MKSIYRSSAVAVLCMSFLAVSQPAELQSQPVAVQKKTAAPTFDQMMTVPVGGMCLIDVPSVDLDKLDFVIIGGEYRWNGTAVVYIPKTPVARVLLDARSEAPLLLVPTQEEYRGTYHVVITGGTGIRIQPLTIGTGPAPDPVPPGPVPPGPIPPTPVPDGTLGFTKLAYEQGLLVAPSFRSLAAAVADNFDGTASAISAGTIKSVDAANAEMVAKNRATIGDAGRAAWLPFFTSWQAAADAALKAGTLKASADAYAEVYRATAQGLRRVR